METGRAVMVRYRDDQGVRRAGSGLRIGGNRVLTAAHVAAGTGHTVMLGSAEPNAAVLIRSTDPEVDLAVLELGIPPEEGLLPLGYARVDRDTVATIEGCTALGYPAFKKGKDGYRRSVQVDGFIPTGEGFTARPGTGTAAGYLSLKATGPVIRDRPPLPGGDVETTPWAGMSGAVAFDRNDRILGVVRHHNPAEGTGTLALTPIEAIDSLPAPERENFWAALGVTDPDRLPRLPGRGTLLRDGFRALLRHPDYAVFAGRDDALSRIGDFLAGPGSVLAVTAPAGLGKTALLASLVRENPDRFAYHFFTNRYFASWLDEAFFLRNMLEQLEPAGAAAELQPMALDVLQTRFQHRLGELSGSPAHPGRVLLLDGLDEVTGWSPAPYLSSLPPEIHVIISLRDTGQDWRSHYGLQGARPLRLDGFDRDAVTAVFTATGEHAADLIRRSGALDTIMEKAAYTAPGTQAGNGPVIHGADPLHIRFLAEDANDPAATPEDLENQPKGFTAYLERWWTDLAALAGDEPVRDFLSILTAALGPLTRTDLEFLVPGLFAGWAGVTFDQQVLPKIRRVVTGTDETGYAFSHPRLRTHLATPRHVPASALASARERLLEHCRHWDERNSLYALAKGFSHHLELFKEADNVTRHLARTQLVRLVCDPTYQSARVEKASDTAGLIADCGLLVAALATEPEVSVNDLVEASIEQSHVRSRWLRPEFVFSPAQLGRYEEALNRMPTLSGSDTWRSAALLCMAWMAALRSETQMAKQLLPPSMAEDSSLDLLAARVLAAIDSTAPQPPLKLPYAPGMLPETSNVAVANNAVERFGSSSAEGVAYSGLAPLGGPHGPETPSYLTEEDAPLIVAAARDSREGDDLLEQYIDLHAANPYASYRDRSLWTILGAVLCLPKADQALHHAVHLCEGAFAPSPVRFAEALQLSALARQATAAKRLEQMREDALRAATGLRPTGTGAGGRSGHIQSQADRWSHHRRRLAAHAEAIAPSDPATAALLLDKVTTLAQGFAGYQAPATLTITESNFIVRPGNSVARRECLAAALSAAHNVQDPAFAARITSQVHAVIRLWEKSVDDIGAQVSRFVRQPSNAEFAAVHIVGEQFARRDTVNHLSIDKVTTADTVEALAHEVFQVPVGTLELINPGIVRDTPLAPGTVVHIPDPSLAPLIATWLSAQILGSGLTIDRKTSLIASLVPAASSNPTLLDTLLARLVQVAPDLDPVRLETVSRKAQTVEPPGAFEFGLS